MKTIMGEIISDLIGQAFSHIGDDSFDSDAYANELLAEKMNAEDARYRYERSCSKPQ